MNYYQFHISDYALHTSHLTLEEDAVFRRLLDFYYDTESPIPEETKPVIRRLRLSGYECQVEAVLQEFFILEADGWHNLRADSVIQEYNLKAERARENGKRGGRPKKNKVLRTPETKPVIYGMQEKSGSKANEEPITSNENKNHTSKSAISPCPVEKIIEIYKSIAANLPGVRVVADSTKAAISARWRSDEKFRTLEFWEKYFRYCEDNEFLSGRSDGKPGQKPFRADLDWLVKASNFAKVLNEKYR